MLRRTPFFLTLFAAALATPGSCRAQAYPGLAAPQYPYYTCYGYCPYTPPYNPYIYNPDGYRGYLSGAANVIGAQGQFQVATQKANLIRQQVDAAKTNNRRQAFDEWLYERQLTPTREDNREGTQAQELRRMLNDPPASEIDSGQAPNVILADVQKLRDLNLPGPVVPLDPATLRAINVSSGSGGDVGLLKSAGKFVWPLALTGPEFAGERGLIDSLSLKLVKQATAGAVDPNTLNQLGTVVESARRILLGEIDQLPVMDFIRAKHFLNHLQSALQVLQQPDAPNYFNGKYAARGKTVADLVKYMTDQGLTFAPAVDGQQSAYMALYDALAHYDLAARAGGPGPVLAQSRVPPR